MSEEREAYGDREIVVTTREGTAELRIDGHEIEMTYLEAEDVYSTEYFPYRDFESATELGRAIVDNWSRVEPSLGERADR
jgi:hypothetical protein